MNNYKFRGKRTYINQWVYGSCYTAKNGEKYILEDDYLIEDGHHLRCNSDMPVFIRQETVGQWTGLFDKNGKEIYCGDILKIPPQKEGNKNGLVFCTWGIEQDMFGCIGFNLTYNPDIRSGGVVVSKSFEYEVIGNIHDNPELLEEK